MSLPDPLLIGLAGPAGAGKDTAAAYLCQARGFESYAFAAPMRAMLEALLAEVGCPSDWLHDPQLKARPIPGLGVSYRLLAQTLGTEWGRECVDADLWVRVAERALGLPSAPVHDRIVISDVRFPNEAAWIVSHGGKVLRIDRNVPPVREHVSEQLFDHLDPFATVDNNGTPEWLAVQLDEILVNLGVNIA